MNILVMTMALGPGFALYVVPHGWYDAIYSFLCQRTNNDNLVNENEKSDEDNSQKFDEISPNSLNSIEMNPFDLILGDDSSLQLLSSSQLETSLDRELGIDVELNNDDVFRIDSPVIGDRSPTHSETSNSRASSNGIHFVSSHFSRNSSTDEFEEEFELLSESEIQEDNKMPKRLPKESSV
jgi:hypothetical protein